MTKLLIIIGLCGAVASGLARSRSDPPLLIDSQPAQPPIDGAN